MAKVGKGCAKSRYKREKRCNYFHSFPSARAILRS